jgi:hypothetical protein
MQTKMVLVVLFGMLFVPIINRSIKRAADSSPPLYSPALIAHGSFDAEPEKLGALVFAHSDEMLSPDQVMELARGFARAKNKNEEWVTRFFDGYRFQAERHEKAVGIFR